MKINYYGLKSTFMAVALNLVVIVMIGCTSYKATSDLNVYHPNAYNVVGGKVDQIEGVFCAPKILYDELSSDGSQKPQLSIVIKNGYSRYITGNINAYDKNAVNTYSPLTIQDINRFSVYERECGANKKYPYIYWFTIDLQESFMEGKSKKAHMAEYYDIINQIKQNKYLDVRAIVVPMVSTSVIGSAQDARMYFTDEQIPQLFLENK